MVSKKLIAAIKLSGEPAYLTVQRADPPMDPCLLSKLLRGIVRVKPGDERVIRIGKVLRIPPKECFKGGSAS